MHIYCLCLMGFAFLTGFEFGFLEIFAYQTMRQFRAIQPIEPGLAIANRFQKSNFLFLSYFWDRLDKERRRRSEREVS